VASVLDARKDYVIADIGLAENGGGVIGFDEAACSVIILQAPSRGSMLPGV